MFCSDPGYWQRLMVAKENKVLDLEYEVYSTKAKLEDAEDLLWRVLAQMNANCQHDDLQADINDFLNPKK